MKKMFVLLPAFLLAIPFLKGQNETIYQSKDLRIEKISPSVYRHITWLHSEEYGDIACNGMLVIHEGEALIFDTPAYDAVSVEMYSLLTDSFHLKIKGVVVNHFHLDCLGGLQAFHDRKVPSYAHNPTIEAAAKKGNVLPEVGFDSLLILMAGSLEVHNLYAGPAHTTWNIYSYVPAEKVLFGGCSVKSLQSGKGNLEDADTESWSNTMQIIRERHKAALEIVIPGHGRPGGPELLDYTAKMFENK